MFATEFDPVAKLWHGPEIPPLYNPEISLAHALFDSMKKFGPKIAQISDNNGVQMTFAEMHERSIKAALNLQARGFKPKQVFGMIARNSHLVAPITIASIAIGCPLVNLNAQLNKDEMTHLLRITSPALMLCDVDVYEKVKECLRDLGNPAKILTFDGTIDQSESVEALFEDARSKQQFRPIGVNGPNDTAMLFCTSGTTGLSKVNCWSHAALIDGLCQFGTILDSNDVLMSYFSGGMLMLLQSVLNGETRIITTENFSPEAAFRLIEKYRVTCTFDMPLQLIRMLRSEHFGSANLSSWKHSILVGGQLPPNIKLTINQKLPCGNVVSTYGMSEISGPMAFDYPPSKKIGSSGQLIPGCCVKIIDEYGNSCSVNEKGEVRIKMRYRFLGYLLNEEANKGLYDEENFMRTGDIGYFNANGDLFICGRMKDLFKYCGVNVFPADIDAFLVESPLIKSACAVGIPDPLGDLPAVLVIRETGSDVSEKEIFDMVADNFPDHYKLRGGVYFVDSLPTTKSSKIQRKKVRDMAIELFNGRKM